MKYVIKLLIIIFSISKNPIKIHTKNIKSIIFLILKKILRNKNNFETIQH